jgi:hypothetical protein
MIDLKEFECQDSYDYVGDHCVTKIINLQDKDIEYILFNPSIGCVEYKTIEFKEKILIPINKVMRMMVK